jgi:Na+/melibiose symporter-like transporter|tara:strand:- start:16 stop:309 length:294 start_codon:yes stop_codon:yes gene_type:complete
MGWWNALNGPFVARWADSGMLNRHVPWFASWGRRAPWLLLGTPLLMAGTVMMWLPPALDDTTLLVWYALCYFLVINGGTASLLRAGGSGSGSGSGSG